MSAWARAFEGTAVVVLVQFFIFYFQFVATDCVAMPEVLCKTFLIAPLLIFVVNWAAVAVLNTPCCKRRHKCAQRVVVFSGLVKSLVITWSTTSARMLAAQGGLGRVGVLFASFAIAFGAFLLVGLPSAMQTQPSQSWVRLRK